MRPSELAKLKKNDPEVYEKHLAAMADKKEQAESKEPDSEEAEAKPAPKPVVMISPAMRAKQQKAVILAGKPREIEMTGVLSFDRRPVGLEVGQYEVALASLKQDQKALKEIERVAEKIDYKRKTVAQYVPFLNAYIESGAQYQNEVLVMVALWCLDVEDIEIGLALAEVAVTQQQVLPGNFKRTTTEVFAEMITDWAERQYKQQASASPYLERVAHLVDTNAWPVAQVIIESKLYRQAALNAELAEDLPTAVMYYEKCVEANPEKHGVKTKLEKAKAQLAKQTPAPKE